MSLVVERTPTGTTPTRSASPQPVSRGLIKPLWPYVAAGVAGLLLIEVFQSEISYAIATVVLGFALFAFLAVAVPKSRPELFHITVDRSDLVMIALVYVAVVAFYRLAFVIIANNDLLLFAFFATGLLVGAAGPVVYTVWGRRRSLATLGLSAQNIPQVALLALLFAAVQFSITFWGYDDLPGTKDVVTLSAMALMVGIFETIFFRGFIQGRLEASFGTAPAVFGAALLYGSYHVGYGMGLEATWFLAGLGIVYALAYATANNFFLMYPLLTPVGSLFAQLDDGDLVGRLPWAALLGFAEVIAVMLTILWFARKHERKLDGASS